MSSTAAVFFSQRTAYQVSPLHQAQSAASNVFNTHFFPCYSPEYIQSQECLTGKVIWCYSKVYDAFSAVNHGVVSAVNAVASGVLSVGDCALGWAIRPVLDVVCPVNPINGHRQFLCIPRDLEKAFGDFLYYPLITYGMRETNELLPGTNERIGDKVNHVMERIKASNSDLLNPQEETAKFNYRVKTVHSSQVNAFAVPAGGMVVFTQIVKEIDAAIKSQAIKQSTIEFADGSRATVDLSSVNLEDTLAALLGHEMTHVASRHSFVAIVVQMVSSTVLSTIRILLCSHLNPHLHNALLWLEERINKFLELLNSRTNEYEADVTGAYFAKEAHFNPLGAIYLQEILKQGSWEYSDFIHKYFEFIFTHPYVENRKRAIFAAIHSIDPGALQGRIAWNIADNGYDLNRSSPAIKYAHHLSRTVS